MNKFPDFTFSVEGEGVSVDPATGLLTVAAEALLAGVGVVMTARDATGNPTSAFRITVTLAGEEETPLPAAAPRVTGTLADQLYVLGEGARSVSTQALFSGEGLTYALEAAPPGVSIQPGSGLVTIPLGAAIDGRVTVVASNAGGAARLSFGVAVRSTSTVFSAASTLSELAFLVTEGAASPAVSFDARGFAKIIPAATGRTHGIWPKAGGEGLYRVLARWSSAKPAAAENTPFVLGLGVGLSGSDLTGAYVAVQGAAAAAERTLRIFEYAGAGAAAVERAQAVMAWAWDTVYCIEAELVGTRLRARIYPEAGTAPDWMISADLSASVAAAGAYGPGGVPAAGASPTLLVKRLDFVPRAALAETAPAAAADAEWSLSQVTE